MKTAKEGQCEQTRRLARTNMTALLAAVFILLQLLCQVFATEGSGGEPPNGYVKFPEYNAAYKIHEDDVPWATARDRCAAEGAHLAVITSVEQMKQIVNSTILEMEMFLFIGIWRPSSTSDWVRIDNGRPERFVPWSTLTDDENSNCAAIWRGSGGVITNAHCNFHHAFVCEIPTATESVECEPPSDYVKFPQYGTAYKIHEDAVPWATARDRCAAEGAHLAVITSPDQIRQIVDGDVRKSETFLYMGIRRPSSTSDWVRIDNGRPERFVPWTSLTDHEDYNCAAIWRGTGGVITNTDCDCHYAFICEISLPEGCTNPVSRQE